MPPETLFRRPRVQRALATLVLLLAGCEGGAYQTPAPDAQADRPRTPVQPRAPRNSFAMSAALAGAIRTHARDVWVDGAGTVIRVLRDDTHGSPHQRFLIRLRDDTTVLVAHNIALAPRLEGLRAGDVVAFRGEYIWTPQGGTLHWTHHDPDGRQPGGWLQWRGRTYE